MELWKKKNLSILSLKILIVLLVCNYMIVSIVLGDFPILKYARDIILLCMIIALKDEVEIKFDYRVVGFIIFLLTALNGMFRADNLSLGILVMRKYTFPLLLLLVVYNSKIIKSFDKFLKFIMIFFTVFSIWGVFQAQVLGDEFLKWLGYPVEFSYAYQREMLYNSYYFGGLGIQRVVSTISNSNVCALILGITLIFLVFCYPYLKNNKFRNISILLIAVAYILTFSRSNILAMVIVTIFIAWRYIPHKRELIIASIVLVIVAIIIGVIQGQNGILYEMVTWIKDSLSFKESSAAGRSGRWLTALLAVLRNPLGIGFGHVGSVAYQAGVVENYYSCENSYLAMLLDTGWLSAVLYIGLMVSMAYTVKMNAKKCMQSGNDLGERICNGAYAVLIYLFINMFFSNFIYDMEAISIAFIYIGIALSVLRKNNIEYCKEVMLAQKGVLNDKQIIQ